MHQDRRAAVVAGALFLLTHVTSVTAAVLYRPTLDDPSRAITGGSTAVLVGVVLEVVLAAGVVGTAVALHPVLRRYREGLSIGYVGLRTLEGSAILTSAVVMLAIVGVGGAGVTSLPVVDALIGVHDAAFFIGQGLVVGIDTVVLAWLLWTTRLVPRWIPLLGLIGGPLVFVSDIAVIAGAYDQVSPLTGLGALPVFAWEISLALYLILKGLRTGEVAPPAPAEQRQPVAVA
jgi:hypothetical protein